MALTVTELQHDNYERVVEFSEDDFTCFIAVHNTKLGPALGGCRIKPYASKDDALLDVLRLSKAMTYKSSLAGVNLGGGKCVVMADHSTRDIMLKVGEAVNYLKGLYITAEDIGTTLPDIEIAAEVTQWTVHIDGSPNTALGVLECMKAAVKYYGVWGEELSGIPIWVQGLGKVGFDLFKRLHAEDEMMNLFVSDLRTNVVQQAIEMSAREITEADKKFISIYSPCAMGQVVNVGNIDSLRYSIICGSANNQLTDETYADILHTNGVLYVPDYLANAGGVITAAGEIEGWTEQETEQKCADLGTWLLDVFALADDDDTTPLKAANRVAEFRFDG